MKDTLIQNGIKIENELTWGNETLKSKSIYFRDPAGNLVEFITKGNWPVED
jgi:catechol-2,3-dioxygenase